MAEQREDLREKVYRLTVQQRDAAWAEIDALRADLRIEALRGDSHLEKIGALAGELHALRISLKAANEREARLREALQQIRQEVGTSTLAWLIATRALADVPEATAATGATDG